MDYDDDVFSSNASDYLSPRRPSARKSPSRQSLRANGHRSTASLRGSSLADAMDGQSTGGAAGGSQFSLAHELAAALMPEPSAGSKLLAEEFGIEYDEGAEGIDEGPEPLQRAAHISPEPSRSEDSLADDAFGATPQAQRLSSPAASIPDALAPSDVSFGSPQPVRQQRRQLEQDPIEVLTRDLEDTDTFLKDLRKLDAEHTAQVQPALEQAVSDVIRRINEAVRDREGQVRELFECERQFRKLGAEIGGEDVLGQLDELERVEGLDPVANPSATTATPALPPIEEKRARHSREDSVASVETAREWDDPRRSFDRDDPDEDAESEEPPSPVVAKAEPLLPPPAMDGPPTPSRTIPQLTHLRTFTASLVSSLSTVSEQAQVNGAGTTEAARKIRALKNKMGGWQSEWESAERSRVRIERWEAGIVDGDVGINGSGTGSGTPGTPGTPATPGRTVGRRIDGRKLVEEHLRAFELAIAEAGAKTQKILEASA